MTGQDVQRLEARIAAMEGRMEARISALEDRMAASEHKQDQHLRDHQGIEHTLVEIRTGVRLIKYGVGVLTSGGFVGLIALLMQFLARA